jgi:zinc transport system ATP-binding protein
MIEVSNLNFRKKNKYILENIQLQIPKGEFVAIIGPNGAGKSSLLKIILDLITDYEGEIKIEGISNKVWLKQNMIGYLPQHEEFDPNFPARAIDIVLMGLAGMRGVFHSFSKQDHVKAEKAMEQVGVLQVKKNYIGTLSGGEFQRVLLARALVTGSDYLFLDEPEASVDQDGVVGFFDLLADLHKQGKTIITVSHDLNVLTNYCDFLICLNRTLHCHTKTELVNAELLHKTFGETVHIIEKGY